MRNIKQLFMRDIVIPGMAVCSLLVPLNVTHAAPVTFNFTGLVSDVSDPLAPPISAMGQQVQGSFTFNLTPATGGTYNGVVTGFSLAFNGTPYSASFTPGANAVRVIDAGGNGMDSWRLSTEVTGTEIDDYTPISFNLRLNGKNMFTSDELQPPNLSAALTSTRWRLIFENGEEDVARVQGIITSLTAVPLPAAVVLFGAGLISLIGLGAGGLRNLRTSQV